MKNILVKIKDNLVELFDILKPFLLFCAIIIGVALFIRTFFCHTDPTYGNGGDWELNEWMVNPDGPSF